MAKRAVSAIVQVKVRMREDLRRKLESEATKHGQTMNAEILERLERSFGWEETVETTATNVKELLKIVKREG
jgi:hypothetical protein